MNGNLYLLFGNEGYLMKNKTEKIMGDHGVDAIDVEFFDIEETPIEDAVNAAMTIPFLSDKKGVVLKNCSFLSSVKTTKEQEMPLNYLLRYLQKPNPTTILVLQAPYEKLDSRKQAYKICQETCKIEECASVKKEDLYPVIRQALSAANKTMDANALEEFVNRTSDDVSLSLNELEKLVLYSGTKNAIDVGMVRLVTTRNLEDNVFELVNAILAKDSRSVTKIYQDLAQVNSEPAAILSLISGKFQEILYTKELLRMNKSFDEVMKYFGATKGRTYHLIKNARDLADEQLLKYMNELEKVDFRVKSGAIDRKVGLELFLLGI